MSSQILVDVFTQPYRKCFFFLESWIHVMCYPPLILLLSPLIGNKKILDPCLRYRSFRTQRYKLLHRKIMLIFVFNKTECNTVNKLVVVRVLCIPKLFHHQISTKQPEECGRASYHLIVVKHIDLYILLETTVQRLLLMNSESGSCASLFTNNERTVLKFAVTILASRNLAKDMRRRCVVNIGKN